MNLATGFDSIEFPEDNWEPIVQQLFSNTEGGSREQRSVDFQHGFGKARGLPGGRENEAGVSKPHRSWEPYFLTALPNDVSLGTPQRFFLFSSIFTVCNPIVIYCNSTIEHDVSHRCGIIILDCHSGSGYKSTAPSNDSINDISDINLQLLGQAPFESCA